MTAYTFEVQSATTGEIITYMKAHTNFIHIWRKAKARAKAMGGITLITIQKMHQDGTREVYECFMNGVN